MDVVNKNKYVQRRSMKSYIREIRTVNTRVKLGETIYVSGTPIVLIKQGKKIDTISLDEFASQLYGRKVRCEVILM